jgi:hypothetical protein
MGWNSYQIEPDEDYNEIILHIRFKETDARYNKTLGILGVNLIYGAYYKYNDPKIITIHDHLDKDQLEIDTINFLGLAFADVDNRLMSLQLVKNGMTDAVMFDLTEKHTTCCYLVQKKYSCFKR